MKKESEYKKMKNLFCDCVTEDVVREYLDRPAGWKLWARSDGSITFVTPGTIPNNEAMPEIIAILTCRGPGNWSMDDTSDNIFDTDLPEIADMLVTEIMISWTARHLPKKTKIN